MGCRCSRGGIGKFDAEDKIFLEHQSLAEQAQRKIREVLESACSKELKQSENAERISSEEHTRIYASVVQASMKTWKQ
jgi:hypothetical protein